MEAIRGTHCWRCGNEYTSGVLDPDDFNADLENLGWLVPDELGEGHYYCPTCKPTPQDTEAGDE